ncbi:dihydrolipoyl dehydrogenase family protein [Minwuia thermotolerans]|uniref:Dihydrolipoamide dehydrogenase n=1 Tax=Minwuia thermotolerans TaxID=2056226 RepID=A0A2M9G6N5_9PROT|nr:FAD-dependent oxidoreductase [Minwuia thermotolerans]PJK31372.1 dihydrolipoamide dehydrogenase [Minwuia thermotolerans]
MPERIDTDICVIGAGSGGLSVAAGAVQMGAPTVLIEGGRMGGDCLNYGCVPSKSLLAAAHHAAVWRRSGDFGVRYAAPEVRFDRVNDHVRSVIDAIAPHDSQERFEGLGVQVIRDWARFVSPREVEAGGALVRARRFVIATGSRPVAPPIPGLEEAGYLTNETIFDNRVLPGHLIVIGGGPIGMELAQAHAELGARVTLLEAARVLGRDDPELAAIAADAVRESGVDIREGVKIARVEAGPAVVLEYADSEERIEGSHLLVAAGRRANLERLDLHKAGIEHGARGLIVDRGLKTTNRRVYAVGDAAGGLQFTHVAGHHAGLVIRNALFRLPVKDDPAIIPWTTYTDPELAWVGLQQEAARSRHGDIDVLRWPLADNDRARAERRTEGLAKAVVHKGRVIGAGIVGPGAGDLIGIWALAVKKRMKVADLAGFVAPYPTMGEVTKRLAGSYYTPKLFSDRTRRIVRLLARFG